MLDEFSKLNHEMILLRIKCFVGGQDKREAPLWRETTISFADAENPEFAALKREMGPDYLLPTDLLPGAKTVIAYFIPFTERLIKTNTGGTERSLAWDLAYRDTNLVIEKLNDYMISEIQAQGFRAVAFAPTIDNDETDVLTSNWSHRHVARIAELGQFGLNNLLITSMGCCGRLGSIVTDVVLSPTPKGAYSKEAFYCLYLRNGSCGACVTQCPNQCFGEDPENPRWQKPRCAEQIYHKGAILPDSPSNRLTCGKCMCGLPCSMRIPT